MQHRRLAHNRHARRSLFCGLACFVLLIVLSNVLLEYWHPDEIDCDYTLRSAVLAARRAAEPGKPHILVMGSSRIAIGFAPEWLNTSANQPIVFNFSRFGQGPKLHSIYLQRLERDGLLPDAVVLEVIPAYLYKESSGLLVAPLSLSDFNLALRYLSVPDLVKFFVLHRLEVGSRYPERLLGWRDRPLYNYHDINPLGGYQHLQDAVSDATRREKLAVTHKYYHAALSRFCIDPDVDRALRDCLEFCQARHIETVVLLSPEGSTLRSWYRPGADELIRNYFAGLERTYNFRMVDGRDWFADRDFYDDHHALRSGAEILTFRLGRDVLSQFNVWNRDGQPRIAADAAPTLQISAEPLPRDRQAK